jgi:Spy/CpxP family protein refolding chaperone
MMPPVVRRLLLTLAVLGLAGTVSAPTLSAQSVTLQRFWWKTDPTRKDLGLTHEQSTKLDRIWSDALPTAQQNLDQLDRYESHLSKLIETDSDEIDILRAVDKIEALRATMNKNRTLLLVHMRQVLTADQRTKMNVMLDQMQQQQQKDRQAAQAQQIQSQPSQSQPSRGTTPPQRSSAPPASPATSSDPHKKPE